MDIAKKPLKIRVTDEILLKQLELSDAEDVFKTIDSQREYLGKWLPFVEKTKTMEDTEHYILSTIKEVKQFNYVFAIRHGKEFAGIAGFKDTDKQNKKTEIGYWLSQPFQKKGIITKSVKKLCEYAFTELEINRVQIKCAVGNKPSKRIPKALGFKHEGVERDGELLAGNKFTDLEVYSLLKTEVDTVPKDFDRI